MEKVRRTVSLPCACAASRMRSANASSSSISRSWFFQNARLFLLPALPEPGGHLGAQALEPDRDRVAYSATLLEMPPIVGSLSMWLIRPSRYP
ncbi:MAG: hypothetical protein ACLVL7_02670 [Anaerotruncus massiliensis (ex Togo et al. 2019)]